MTTTATPRHTGDRYAARTRGREKTGHLLLITWAESIGRRGRPSLCGQIAKTWRRVDTFDQPIPPCLDCSTAAGITPPQPRRLLTDARRGAPLRLASPGATAHVLDPQHANTALPSGWRPRRLPSLPMTDPDGGIRYGLLAPDAQNYVPPAQLDREHSYWNHQGLIDFPPWAPLTYATHPGNG